MAKRIHRVVRNVPQHWVGDGFPVRSLFSYGEGNRFDPFLLLDYAGPHEFAPQTAPRGVGEHPHRGFETVTIVYEGELEHRDSGGNRGKIGAGDVQWMTAAAGVVHEEFHSERFSREGGVLEMVQLWVNLPASEKMSSPRYQEILDSQIPRIELPQGAGAVRVIAGAFGDVRSPARTVTPILVWDLTLAAEQKVEIPVPDRFTTLVVVQRGALRMEGGDTVTAGELVEFELSGEGVALESAEDARVLLLSGEPIGEPVAGQGPFVMNTREEIRQAIVDYQSGRMGTLQAAPTRR